MMNRTLTTTADHLEITFDGYLIKRATSSVSVTGCDERTFTLELHSVTEGGFVTAIEVDSSNVAIARVLEVERVDTADNMESCLLLCEPMNYTGRRRRKRHECTETARRNENGIMYAYYKPMDEILPGLREYGKTHPGSAFVATPGKPHCSMQMFGF
jgi:hypothetical protein